MNPSRPLGSSSDQQQSPSRNPTPTPSPGRCPSIASSHVDLASRPASAVSRTFSIASTIGNLTLAGDKIQSIQDHQENQWPLQWWSGGDQGAFPRAAYESYIDFLTAQWPHLKELQKWMSGSETYAGQRKHRVHKLPTTVLDFRDGAAPIRREYSDDSGLRDTGNSYSHLATSLRRPTPATVKGRMIIVPYLTASIINVLGSAFDIDPEFFHGHLGLPTQGGTDPFPSDEYLRIALGSDLPRPEPGADSQTQETKISVRVHLPDKERGNHWTSIVLLDALDEAPGAILATSQRQRLLHNFLRKPKFSKGPAIGYDLFHDYIQLILDQPSSEYTLWASDPFFGLNYLYSYAIREWAALINLADRKRAQLEQEAMELCERASDNTRLDDPLVPLRNLKEMLLRYHTTIASMHETIQNGGKAEWKALRATSSKSSRERRKPLVVSAALERDSARVLGNNRAIIKRIDAAMSLVTNKWNIILSQKGIEQHQQSIRQAESIQTLLRLALVMLPLLVVTSVFSMNIDDLKPLYKPGTFAIIAIAFTVITILILQSWFPVAKLVRRMRAGNRGKQERQNPSKSPYPRRQATVESIQSSSTKSASRETESTVTLRVSVDTLRKEEV